MKSWIIYGIVAGGIGGFIYYLLYSFAQSVGL
jgi:hypothetical protein